MSNKPWLDSRKPRLKMQRRAAASRQRHPGTDNASVWAGLLLTLFIIVSIALLAATASPSCYEATRTESSSGKWQIYSHAAASTPTAPNWPAS